MKHLLFFLAALFSLTSNCQITFEKGYFINNSNEKTECYIRNVDWMNNPTEFEYKTNLSDSRALTVTIANISEFSVESGSKYQRLEVTIEKSQNSMSNLSTSKYPVWQKETHFLKVLSEGDAWLYYYTDGSIFKFFYKTKTIPLEQLVCIRYKATDPGTAAETVKTNDMFKQQLLNNVKRENASESELRTLEYNTESLLKYFNKYNGYNTKDTSDLSKKNKGIFNVKATAGFASTLLRLDDPNGNANSNLSTNASKAVFNFGAELEYVLPFNKNKWALFINPAYQKLDTEKKYIRTEGMFPSHDVEHSVKVDYTSIEIPVGVRYYMFLNKNSKLFLNLAYSVNLSSGSKITLDNAATYKIEPMHNFVFGMGYTYKDRYSLEVHRIFPRELLGGYVEWSARYSAIGVQLSYKVL